MSAQRSVRQLLQKVMTYSQYKVCRNNGFLMWRVGDGYLHGTCYRQFHLTTFYLIKKKVLPKLRKPIVYTKKVERKQVDIYEDMTVPELIEIVGFSESKILQIIWKKGGQNFVVGEKKVINNFKLIKNIVTMANLTFRVVDNEEKNAPEIPKQPPPRPEDLVNRPPIVTIMGHVDHGKTTLLDALRKSNIVEKEFGGITQHIGAFLVKLPSGETITFLDTPGHAAFSSMRARGADITDLVILVIAADDGVLPQTIESINHAKHAKVPIIVAVNKIDTPGADVERVRRMLMEHDVIPEEDGGSVQMIPISALKGINILALQEAVIAEAELMELKGDPTGFVEATVIEAEADQFRGKIATIIVQRGTLKKGDILVAGTGWIKVKAMLNEHGQPMEYVGPSIPVSLIGWKQLPSAGDPIIQVKSEKIAKSIIDWREKLIVQEKANITNTPFNRVQEELKQEYLERREKRLTEGYKTVRMSDKVSNILKTESINQHEGPSLSVILKGDVHGSVEAILDVLNTYSSNMCKLYILSNGVGDITESDIEQASVFDGVVYGFNVKVSDALMKLAKEKNVSIKIHNIIYRLFECLHDRLNERLPEINEEETIGEANVLKTFVITENKQQIKVAGCQCISGSLMKKQKFKVLRNGEILHRGQVAALKHGLTEVESVSTHKECGISFVDKKLELQKDDIIVCYEDIVMEQQIDWEPEF